MNKIEKLEVIPAEQQQEIIKTFLASHKALTEMVRLLSKPMMVVTTDKGSENNDTK